MHLNYALFELDWLFDLRLEVYQNDLTSGALVFLLQDTGDSLPIRDTIVVANPGTGKTWEIVERVMQLLKAGVKGEDIVCVTFTNKAADEMKSRIIKGATSRKDLFDQALRIEVSTIHSYAMSYLQSSGNNAEIASNTVLRYIVFNKLLELNTFNYGSGYLIEWIVPKIENGIRYLKSFGIVPENVDKGAVSKIVKEKIVNTKSANLTSKAIDVLVNDFVTIFEAYENFKNIKKTMDYNDLLRIFLEKMGDKHKKIVLVDEFQDLNRLQVDIVGKLAETRFFVGDRKQSIFGFQGGSLSSFNRYLEDSSFERLGKTINHRSTNNILNYASSYFLSYSKDNYSREEIEGLRNPEKSDGEKVTLVPSADPTSDSIGILQGLLSEEYRSPRNIAIIARYNHQITKITSHLDSLGIPYSSTILNKVNQSQIDEILTYISGLVSDDPAAVSRALLTPFAGLKLKEAIELSKVIKENGLDAAALPLNFHELRELKFGLSMIEEAFNRVILPIAASLGDGYVNSANLTIQSAREYIAIFPDYSLEGFLNFMTMSSEQNESELKKSNVNVLTVHKAKGLEFDTVIYVPSELRPKLEYFDLLTSTIILTSTGIDVQQDLLEEPLRIDFVAITRPKEKLYIVAENRLLPRFELQNAYYDEISVSTDFGSARKDKFDEAYMMFVNGRFDEAKGLLKEKDQWLVRTIKDYFSGVTKLSYSEIDAIYNPYSFLRNYILKIRQASPFTERGTNFHEVAHRYATGSLNAEDIPDEVNDDFKNLELALNALKTDYVVPPQFSELSLEIPLSAVFPDQSVPDDIMLKGKIDAVFKSARNSGAQLIADYKTSRSIDSKYWQQLWLYTRMYQKKYGISPENISGGVIYVGLRETINTGDRGYEVQVRDYYKIKTDVVERRLQEYLFYMEQPDSFIEKLISKSPETELDSRLRDILEKSI